MALAQDAAQEQEARIIAEGQDNEVNPWLERTQWNTYLLGLDRYKVSQTINRPDSTVERAADALWNITESMIRHCQTTLADHVGHFIRMEVVRTEKHQTKLHPLQPNQSPQSLGNYTRAWQHLLMVFQRVADNKARSEFNDSDAMPRYPYHKRQRTAWQALQSAIRRDLRPSQDHSLPQSDNISDITADSTTDDDNHLSHAEHACLNFCIALLDHSGNKKEYESPLVCALAVLGIHQSRQMGPDRYPPILSAVIKINRMMAIQHACLVSDSSSSSESDNSGFSQDMDKPSPKKDPMLQVVKDMMNRFMIRGTFGPMQ